MTLTQLEAFVLVARLGSVKAAAAVLGVTEPAVSGALAALREDLGDPLVERSSSGMRLTAAGRRLVPVASQMVALGTEARAVVREESGGPDVVRVVATSTLAEFVTGPLLDLFAARHPGVETTVGVADAQAMPALVRERLADVALGPRLPGLDSVPVMRHQLVVVAGRDHRLTGRAEVPVTALAGEHWLVDPAGAETGSQVQALLARCRVPLSRLSVFPSASSAWASAAEGHGVAPALSRLVAHEVATGRLLTLPVPGLPQPVLWHVSTLDATRAGPGVTALRRFLGTPEAVHVMHRADGSVPLAHFRPPVRVTLWS